jgi:hypothetical protein
LRIVFFAPFNNKPAGGIRAIFSLSKELEDHGIHSGVFQFGNNNFSNGSDLKRELTSFGIEDHIVIPECMLGRFSPDDLVGRNYSVFVQNPYIIFGLKRFSEDLVSRNLLGATNVLTISKDSENILKGLGVKSRIIRLKWKLDPAIVNQAQKLNLELKRPLITYMPRKCKSQIPLIKKLLNAHGYNNCLVELKGISYKELLKQLSMSKVFISLSEFEGFAAPPVEAAVLGNLVVGYHGNGNKELFNLDNFYNIEFGNTLNLVHKVIECYEDYHKYFSFNASRLVLDKFFGENVTSFNLSNILTGIYEPSGLDKKMVKMPSSSFGIFIDKAITKVYQYAN